MKDFGGFMAGVMIWCILLVLSIDTGRIEKNTARIAAALERAYPPETPERSTR